MTPTKPDHVRDAERKATVEYLKRRAEDYRNDWHPGRMILRDIADEIERGRHRK